MNTDAERGFAEEKKRKERRSALVQGPEARRLAGVEPQMDTDEHRC